MPRVALIRAEARRAASLETNSLLSGPKVGGRELAHVSKIPLSLPMEFRWVALQPSSFRTWTQAPPLQPTHALNIIISVSLSSSLAPPLHVAPPGVT